jgi:N-acetyl-anhydromuramyl-L-alanine amidase AmpD/subtilisin family serine protease
VRSSSIMDPALWELMEQGQGSDEVSVIIRLQPGKELPPNVRFVARFGPIVTARLQRADIRSVWSEEDIVSVKAPRLVTADDMLPADPMDEEAVLPGDAARPAGLPYDGSGVVIGVLDWGIDFAHPEFRNPDGSTRLLALWDQRGPASQADNPYGYGRIFSEQEINRALAQSDPFAALGYHPAEADVSGRGSHGTHVGGIAAGNTASIAPGTRIGFVHLSTSSPGGARGLGDSVTILEGIDFIHRISAGRPVVINISAGRHGGSHDGLSLVEQGIDHFLTEHPGRAICQSTGNYFEQNAHTARQLRQGETHTLIFRVDPADRTPNEVEVWYPGRDELVVRLQSPDGGIDQSVHLGENLTLASGGVEIGRLYHRRHDPNNQDHHINLFLYPPGPAGDWRLNLYGKDVVDGRYHAWIERDATCPGCQAYFRPEIAVALNTTGTICNGFHTIAVGAYNPHQEGRPLGSFSSAGPTRDGRLKPNLLAPGVAILSARSAPAGATQGENRFVRMTGTSMAAPAVASVVALMFQAAGRLLPINETRRLLLENTSPYQEAGINQMRAGNGYLDPQRAVQAAAALRDSHGLMSPEADDEEPAIYVSKEMDGEMKNETISDGSFPLDDALEQNDELTAIGEFDGEEEHLVESPCPDGDCGEVSDAENILPVGDVQFGGSRYSLTAISTSADFRHASLDEALKYALRHANQHAYITGSLWTGASFEVFLCQALAIPVPPGVIGFSPTRTVAAIVLNGNQVYLPADPLANASRWVRLNSAGDFYRMGQTRQDRQRRFWINGRGRHRGLNGARNAIHIPGVTVTQAWLRGRSMPELRLMLAYFSAQVYQVFSVNQPADQFLGGEIFGLTLPPIRAPLTEPECYLPVIAEAEGLLEAVNAYDLGAGLSVGPTQFNCIEGYLFQFLKRVWDEDNTLFCTAFCGLNWSMRVHNGHPDLMVNAGTANEIVLHGTGADRNRNVGYFHSGVPGNHQFNQIDADFRRDLTRRFRTLVAWPHIQEIIAEVAAQTELAPALPIIHAQANGIAAINPAALSCDLFVLKALLVSAYVRFSACLRPFLVSLRQWNTPTAKLNNWQNALQNQAVNWGNCTQPRRNRLSTRLQNQQAVAVGVCQAFQSLLAPAVPAGAQPTVPGGAPAAAQPAGAAELDDEGEAVMPDPGDLEDLSWRDNEALVRLAGEVLALGRAAGGNGGLTSQALVENLMSITGVRDPASDLPLGLPPLHQVFDAFFHGDGQAGGLAGVFEVVGLPGGFPIDAPRMGDLLIRHGENGFAHAAFLSSAELFPPGELSSHHLNAESLRPGWYAQVVEGGAFPHTLADRYARRILDAEGYLPRDSLLLRLPIAVFPAGEGEDFETGSAIVLPQGKGMWVEALRGSATPEEMRDRMLACGLSWLAIKLEMRAELGVSGVVGVNPRPVLEQYLGVLRGGNRIPNLGIWLWGWSNPRWDAVRYARVMIQRASEVGAQGVIVDAEGPWKSENPAQASHNRAQAGLLVEALLNQAQPAGLSVGITTFTGIRGFPWAEFSRAHFGMPQIYEREAGLPRDYPTRSVRTMQANGFRVVMPISNAFTKGYSEMEDLLRRTPTPNGAISWWVWNSADSAPDRWRAIASYRIPEAGQTEQMDEFVETAGPMLFVVRNRLINERIASTAVQILTGATIQASGTTNANGQARIALGSLADGDYILNVTPPDNTTALVGPDIARATPRPDRIWRSLKTTVTIAGGRVTGSTSREVTISGNTVTVKLQPAWMCSPNRSARPAGVGPRVIVVHHTGGATISSAINTFLAANSTSAHYVIDTDGQIVKMVHEDEQAFHAGCSHWGGSDSVNRFSVGIEIVNNGSDYEEAQYTALIDLIKRIRGRYTSIPANQIPGHSDIGTCDPSIPRCSCPVKRLGRKSTDPGLTFDWSKLQSEGLGLLVRAGPQPDTIYGGFFRSFPAGRLQLNDNDASNRYGGQAVPSLSGIIAELQDDLRSIGYFCPSNGIYDTATRFTVQMFQEHFFAGSRRGLGNPSGSVDWNTASLIKSVR